MMADSQLDKNPILTTVQMKPPGKIMKPIFEIYRSWFQESVQVVRNFLTLEQDYKRLQRFDLSASGFDHAVKFILVCGLSKQPAYSASVWVNPQIDINLIA